MTRLAAEYVLPLRRSGDEGLGELGAYVRSLALDIDVTVVDGSTSPWFGRHATAFGDGVRHVAVDPAIRGANGKVRGVLTGVGLARHEHIVLADDDVRHDRRTLRAMVDALSDADLVVPQNFFEPAPWHARWDTARALLNRAIGHDYPGTYAVRRSALRATGGYDADVLFENLEMERTIRAAEGRVSVRRDIFVRRRPPSARHFAAQRVRQAYDSFAQPRRMTAELAVIPVLVLLRRRPFAVAALAASIVLLAEVGRRRDHGRAVFGRWSALWAPAWVLERAVMSWLAVGLRLRGGVRYSDGRLARAAHREGSLRRRAG